MFRFNCRVVALGNKLTPHPPDPPPPPPGLTAVRCCYLFNHFCCCSYWVCYFLFLASFLVRTGCLTLVSCKTPHSVIIWFVVYYCDSYSALRPLFRHVVCNVKPLTVLLYGLWSIIVTVLFLVIFSSSANVSPRGLQCTSPL